MCYYYSRDNFFLIAFQAPKLHYITYLRIWALPYQNDGIWLRQDRDSQKLYDMVIPQLAERKSIWAWIKHSSLTKPNAYVSISISLSKASLPDKEQSGLSVLMATSFPPKLPWKTSPYLDKLSTRLKCREELGTSQPKGLPVCLLSEINSFVQLRSSFKPSSPSGKM